MALLLVIGHAVSHGNDNASDKAICILQARQFVYFRQGNLNASGKAVAYDLLYSLP